MKKYKMDLQDSSNEVKNVMNVSPGFLVMSGNPLVLLILLAGCFFIFKTEIPTFIKTPALLYLNDAPKESYLRISIPDRSLEKIADNTILLLENKDMWGENKIEVPFSSARYKVHKKFISVFISNKLFFRSDNFEDKSVVLVNVYVLISHEPIYKRIIKW